MCCDEKLLAWRLCLRSLFHSPMMVFQEVPVTIEPGICIREEGLEVRLDNDFFIRKEGLEDLMASIPIKVEEIEQLMREQEASKK